MAENSGKVNFAAGRKPIAGGASRGSGPFPAENNKKLVGRLIEEVWNKWDFDAACEFIAPDFIDHVRGPGQPQGLRGFQETFTAWRAAFPDWRIRIEEMIAERDLVAVRLSARGTHRGEFAGVAPTGRQVQITATEVFRITDGKIVEFWGDHDELGLLRQIGAVRPGDSRPSRWNGKGTCP